MSCPKCEAANANWENAKLESMCIPESEDYSLHLIEARQILAEIEDLANKRNYFMAKMFCHTLATTKSKLWEALNKLYQENENG
jgi:hypothetical protein